MIDSIEIKNFKSIENLKIENLKNVNFFFGETNSAKTSVLEALHLFLKEDTSTIKDISNNRSILLDDDIIESLFPYYDFNNQTIRISNNNKNLEIVKSDDRKIQITCENREISDKENQSTLIGSFKLNDDFYKRIRQTLQDDELKTELNDYCRAFDDQIEGISIIDRDIYVKILGYDRRINLKSIGQGFISYLSYITEILNRTEHICIDNLETGLSFVHVDLILKIILEQSIQNDIQFFITTHSKELLEQLARLLDRNAEFKDKSACFNLYREDNRVKVLENKIDGFIINMELGNEVRL